MKETQSHLRELLHKKGFRATPDRIHLLELMRVAKQPLAVNEIAKEMNCNIVTIYRALKDLVTKGVVKRQMRDTGTAHFSFVMQK